MELQSNTAKAPKYGQTATNTWAVFSMENIMDSVNSQLNKSILTKEIGVLE